jgi:hypothetical protein
MATPTNVDSHYMRQINDRYMECSLLPRTGTRCNLRLQGCYNGCFIRLERYF